MKDNAIYTVQKVKQDNKQEVGILEEENILLSYKDGKETKSLKLRRITFKDE